MRLAKQSQRWRIALIGVLTLLALSATSLLVFRHSPKPASSTNSTGTYEIPAESPIDPAQYKWTGDPDEPRHISLPTIQGGGFIQKVGINASNQIEAPDNIYIAGWYRDSKKPGAAGLSIIDGHVGGPTKGGIFKQLQTLQAGDEFTVESGSGVKLHYNVMNVVTVNLDDALNMLFSQDPKTKSQLNLITCGGNFDKGSQQYDKRVIVTASLLD